MLTLVLPIMSLINDFLSLIYPRLCPSCARPLLKHEMVLCTACEAGLPKSNSHHDTNSELMRVFAGRVPLVKACSLYRYQKSGNVQRLLHAIKYKGQKEAGEYLGLLFASDLTASNALTGISEIIPIPLHQKRLKSRGYNQSEWFAKGLAAGSGIPLHTNRLQRNKETSTQTRKKKYQRWENVEGVFRLCTPQALQNKHVLLVDDVITTGATIEAAWLALKEVPGIKISVASIAFAGKGNV